MLRVSRANVVRQIGRLLGRFMLERYPSWVWEGINWRKLAGRLPPLGEEHYWNLFTKAIGEANQGYMSYHARPCDIASVGTSPDPWVELPKTAILLQGPLLREDNFTRETIRLYRHHYPSDPIVLSTWIGEKKEDLDACRKEGALLVLSKDPANPGPSNINRQIVSTRAGLEMCGKLGVEYVVKTRTDQRFYNPNALGYLHNLLVTFPIRVQTPQRLRLIGVALNTLKYRRYGLSDMFLFGAISDALEFWSCPLDPRQNSEIPAAPFGPHAELRLGEVYFETNYLERLGRDLLWTIADSWKALAEHFCVVDAHSIDLYWPKYHSHREFRRLNYQRANTGQELSFLDWLVLYNSSWKESALAEAACHLGWDSPLDLDRNAPV